mgnify:CR=1 FL=1
MDKLRYPLDPKWVDGLVDSNVLIKLLAAQAELAENVDKVSEYLSDSIIAPIVAKAAWEEATGAPATDSVSITIDDGGHFWLVLKTPALATPKKMIKTAPALSVTVDTEPQ